MPLSLQGGFLLYVHITDVDDVPPNDLVEDIFIDMQLDTSSTFSVPVKYTGMHQNAMLELSFRVQCIPGFTGADCTSKL